MNHDEAALAETERSSLQRTDMLPSELVARFESLGDNCEFGLVQRHFGAEPVGVFRFSNPKAAMMLRGVETSFAGLGENLRVELDQQQPQREWIVVDPDYRLRQHTYIFEGDPREVSIQSDMRRHFAFLKCKLIEDMQLANKVFVIKSVPNLRREVAESLAAALRRVGPNWLLWVIDEAGAPDVGVAAEGLLQARINGILPEGCPQWGEFPFAQWLEVMTRTWELLPH